MEIKLNNADIHNAIRGFLQERNIVNDETNIDINITATRGATPGASADITIIESTVATTDEIKIEKTKIKSVLFNNDDDQNK